MDNSSLRAGRHSINKVGNDVLVKGKETVDTYCFVHHEPMECLLALELLSNLRHRLVIAFEDLIHYSGVAALGLTIHFND